MTKYRFVRITITGSSSIAYCGFREIDFGNAVTGTPAAITANSYDGSSVAPQYGYDGNLSTAWVATYSNNTAYDPLGNAVWWWQIDFGGLGGFDPALFTTLKITSFSTYFFLPATPYHFYISYSNDGVSWQVAAVVPDASNVTWTDGVPTVFNIPTVTDLDPAGSVQPWSSWMLFVTAANVPYNQFMLGEVQLRTTPGTPQTLSGGTASGSSSSGGNGPANAADGNVSTFYEIGFINGQRGKPPYWAYTFAAPQVVKEIAVTCPTGYTYAPNSFTVLVSSDRITYARSAFGSCIASTWSPGQTQAWPSAGLLIWDGVVL